MTMMMLIIIIIIIIIIRQMSRRPPLQSGAAMSGVAFSVVTPGWVGLRNTILDLSRISIRLRVALRGVAWNRNTIGVSVSLATQRHATQRNGNKPLGLHE